MIELIKCYSKDGNAFKAGLIAHVLHALIVGFSLHKDQAEISGNLKERIFPFLRSHFKEIIENYPLMQWSIYIASLSEKGDDLRQWLPYADDGHGVAIGFKGLKNNSSRISVHQDVWSTRVCYKPDQVKEIYLKRFLEELPVNSDDSLNAFLKYFNKIVELFVVDVVASKSEHYKDEAEWRLCYIDLNDERLEPNAAQKLNFHVKNGILKPYHAHDVQLDAIVDLKLGPRCENELNSQAFQMLSYLRTGNSLQVTRSAVEYRG